MFYCCCPLGLWNVDWSTGTIWSTGTPFLYVQYVEIYLLALIGLYLFFLLFVFYKVPEPCQPLGVVLRILSSVAWQVLYLYVA